MRWTIRKQWGGNAYDTVGGSIVGPNTEGVEVVPASFTDEDTCHEDMGNDPCGKPAVGYRTDPEHGDLYPVCDRHMRGGPPTDEDVERVAEAIHCADGGAPGALGKLPWDSMVRGMWENMARAALSAYLDR